MSIDLASIANPPPMMAGSGVVGAVDWGTVMFSESVSKGISGK